MQKVFVVFYLLAVIFQKSVATITDKEYALLPTLFYQDDYDTCMLLKDEALYCSFEYHLDPFDDTNQIWKNIQEISADSYNYNHGNLRHWICVPLTCPDIKENSENLTDLAIKETINECYDKKFKTYHFKGRVENLKCETYQPKYPVDWIDMVALLFFITYPTFVLFCTLYELMAKLNSPEEYKKNSISKLGHIILSFSLIKNWYRLTAVNNSEEVEYLKPIQGVRFFNTVLVILSHTALANTILPVSNTKYIETMNSKVANFFLSSGPLCVSTFFLMSSTLLTYGIFSQFEKRQLTKHNLIMIFVNRYIRLVPSLAVIIIFNLTWWRHLGSGPNWYNIVGKQFLNCRKNWWTNLLFLNTVIDSKNMCTPIFWYLGLDTQYFVLLLVALWYIKKYEKYIWHILGCLLCLNIIATYINNYVRDLEALVIPRAEGVYDMKCIVGNPQWHGQMVSTIGNTAGAILGIGMGYLIYKTKNIKLFQERRLLMQILVYFFSYVPCLLIILIPGWYILVDQPKHEPVIASIIAAIGRPIFTSGIAIGIFGAMHKIGGPMEYVLKWYPAYILARLAYSAYLVHLTVIMSRPATVRSPVYVSDMYIVYNFLGDFAASYLVGLLMTLFFEMPISALQKFLISTHYRERININKEKSN